MDTWNGALLGYRLHYRQVGNEDYQSLTTPRIDANLTKLVRGVNYEVKISAYNAKGSGPETSPQTVYVGEASKYYHGSQPGGTSPRGNSP